MAIKQKSQTNNSLLFKRAKISRPGVHSKTKNSTTKHNKNYTKSYKGQGK
jgi:hypothetical protein